MPDIKVREIFAIASKALLVVVFPFWMDLVGKHDRGEGEIDFPSRHVRCGSCLRIFFQPVKINQSIVSYIYMPWSSLS